MFVNTVFTLSTEPAARIPPEYRYESKFWLVDDKNIVSRYGLDETGFLGFGFSLCRNAPGSCHSGYGASVTDGIRWVMSVWAGWLIR